VRQRVSHAIFCGSTQEAKTTVDRKKTTMVPKIRITVRHVRWDAAVVLYLAIPRCNTSRRLGFDVARFDHVRALMFPLRCSNERKSVIRILQDGFLLANQTNLLRLWKCKCLLGEYNMSIGDFPTLE